MTRWRRGDDGARLVGVDVARGLAVLGMLWVHFAPDGTGTAFPDGRSAILFATLAGVSLGLLTGGDRPPRGTARSAGYRTVAIRGLALIVLGRLLVLLATPIAVILDYYGVLFLLLLVVLFAPRWVLAVVAVLALTVGSALIQRAGPNPAAAFGSGDALAWPGQWLLTGLYPVALYAAFVAAGLIAARSDLSRRRTQLAMLLAGATLIPIGYGIGGALGIDSSPHANTTWEAIGSGGVAIAVIGLLQLLSGLRAVRTVLSPIADIGAMPLTVYTGQVLVAALFLLPQPASAKSVIAYWWLLAATVGGSLLFAVVWRRLVGRGPLEQLLATVSLAGSAAGARPEEGAGEAVRARSVPAGRAIAAGLAAAVVGVAAVAGLSTIVPADSGPASRAGADGGAGTATGPARVILATAGSVRFDLDAEMLRQAALRPGATGVGRTTGRSIALPITAGQVRATSEALGGGIVLDGSGLSFTRGADEVRLSDFLIDLDAGTVAGDVTVDGTSVAKDTLLFVFDRRSPSADTSGTVAVRGLRLTITSRVTMLIDDAFGSKTFVGDAPIATASMAITGA